MRPLDGVRVLDFFWLGAGPMASLVLGELGAEVIKVESGIRLDKIREGGPYPGSEPDIDKSSVFASLNFGKKSITLNLSHPETRNVVYNLVKRCDVVTNNFKAATMARFGISFDQLRQHNPKIVYITMSTMGASGPCSAYGAYGSHLAAMAGINNLTGSDGEIPIGMGSLFPDFSCNPLHATAAILAGLRHVRTTGEAVDIDISQLESTIHLIGPYVKEVSLTATQPSRMASRHPWRVPHGIYRCAGDDEWIAVSIGSDRAWKALVDLVGQEVPGPWTECGTFLERQRKRSAIDAALGTWTAKRDKWTAARELVATGAPAWPVNTLRDQIDIDPILKDQFVRVALDPEIQATVQRMPIVFEGTHHELPARHPRLGEHTFEILQQLCGYSEERIAELMGAGALD